jgi:hypothetical protein
MSMTALLQVLKVNESRSGTSKDSGRPWTMQDAECLLLNDDKSVKAVGVLMLPKELQGKVTPGVYTGSFSLVADMKTRRINAQLVGLVPVPFTSKG